MYNEYDSVWDKGRCFHPAEIRALDDRCAELQALGISQAAGMTALAGTYESCEAIRKGMGDSAVCPRAQQLAELDAFVTKPEYVELLRETAIQRGKERRPVQLAPDQEVIAQLADALTEDVYFTYSRTSGRSPQNIRQQPGACVQGAYLLQQRFRAIGIETKVQEYHKPPFFFHFSLITDIPELTEQLRFDNTWQQMMPKGTDYQHLPHTLITPVSQTAEAVAALGVPDEWKGVWEGSIPCATGWWEYNSKPLNAIMNTEGWYDRPANRPPEISIALANASATTDDPVLDSIQRVLRTLPGAQKG